MIKLGITGGIGSGKSTVARIFSLWGIPIYIADTESKRLVNTSSQIREQLINLFGDEIYQDDLLNKNLLASYIFNDTLLLEKVNQIIHPVVAQDFTEWTKRQENSPIVGEESAIIFEAGINKHLDKIITVYAPLELKLERIIEREQTTREKVLERIKNQMDDQEKVKLSDFVIVNDNKSSLIEQVADIIKQLGQLNK